MHRTKCFCISMGIVAAMLVVGSPDASARLCPPGKSTCHYSPRRKVVEAAEKLGAALGREGVALADEVVEVSGVAEVDIDSDAETTWVRASSGEWVLESRYDDGGVEHLYTVEEDRALLAEEGIVRPRDEFCEIDLSNATTDEPCVAVSEPGLFPETYSTGRGTAMAIRDEVTRRCSLAHIVERVMKDANTCRIEATKKGGERKTANVILFQPHKTIFADAQETVAAIANEITAPLDVRLRSRRDDDGGQRLMFAGNPILFETRWPLSSTDEALCFGFDCKNRGNDGPSFANGILLDDLFFSADSYQGSSCLKTPGLQPLCEENWNEYHRTTLLSPLGMGKGEEEDYRPRVKIDLDESDEAAFILSGRGAFVLRDMDIVLTNGGLVRVTSPCVQVILERTTVRVQPGPSGHVPYVVRYAFDDRDRQLCEPDEGQFVRGGVDMSDPADLFRLQVVFEDATSNEPEEIRSTRVTRITGEAPESVFSFPSGMPLMGRTMFRRLRVDTAQWGEDATFTRVDDGSTARTIACRLQSNDRCVLIEEAGWPIMILPTGEIESGFDAKNGREINLAAVRAIAEEYGTAVVVGDEGLPEGVRLFTADGRRIVVVGEEQGCPEGMERNEDSGGPLCIGEYGSADVDPEGEFVVTCHAGAVEDEVGGGCVPSCSELPNTSYDRAEKRCEPLPGYEWNVDGTAVFEACPGDALPDTDGEGCVCDRGPLTDAVWSDGEERWECRRPCPENATRVEGECRCDAGFFKSGNACLPEEAEAIKGEALDEAAAEAEDATTDDLLEEEEAEVRCSDGALPNPLTGRCADDDAVVEADADAATEDEVVSDPQMAASGCALVNDVGGNASRNRCSMLLCLVGAIVVLTMRQRVRRR